MVQTAQEIAAERGVTLRRGYMILREQAQREALATPVPSNWRERALVVLYRSHGKIRTSQELHVALLAEGVQSSSHDAAKVLWSLQKTGHVKVRESHKAVALIVRLTQLGEDEGRRLSNDLALSAIGIDDGPIEVVDADGTIAENTIAEATLVEVSVVEEPPHPGWVVEAVPLSFDAQFPVIAALRDRARTAAKLREAAALLEEAGEDDSALSVLEKIRFTELEQEVIGLLARYGEKL